MAAEGDPNIRIQGSVRLVGESPSSITPQSSTTANRSETSTSIMEITTTTTASSRRVKQTTPREPLQVRSSPGAPLNHTHPCDYCLHLKLFNMLTRRGMTLSTSCCMIIRCVIRILQKWSALRAHASLCCVTSFIFLGPPDLKTERE